MKTSKSRGSFARKALALFFALGFVFALPMMVYAENFEIGNVGFATITLNTEPTEIERTMFGGVFIVQRGTILTVEADLGSPRGGSDMTIPVWVRPTGNMLEETVLLELATVGGQVVGNYSSATHVFNELGEFEVGISGFYSGGKGILYLASITVIEEDTPPTREQLVSQLTELIERAEEILQNTRVADSGTGIPSSEHWASQTAHNALQSAVNTARNVLTGATGEPLQAVRFSPAMKETDVIPRPHRFGQLFIQFNQEIRLDPTKQIFLGDTASFQIESEFHTWNFETDEPMTVILRGARVSADGRTIFIEPDTAFNQWWGFDKGETVTIRFEDGAIQSADGTQTFDVNDWTFTITDGITVSAFPFFVPDDDKLHWYCITEPSRRPFIDNNNNIMVPLLEVSDGLWGSFDYDPFTRTVTIQTSEFWHTQATIVFEVGNPIMTVNGNDVTMNTAPVVTGFDIDIFVPVEPLAEAFGMIAEFNQTRNIIILRR